jgi:hypothetical protein
LDILTIALCISVGNAVAWLLALYTSRGFHPLLWDTLFATVGAALCALALSWFSPEFVVAGLVIVGPVFALVAIFAGDALRRALWRSSPKVEQQAVAGAVSPAASATARRQSRPRRRKAQGAR